MSIEAPETVDPLSYVPAMLDELKKQAEHARKWMSYYEGKQALSYLAPEIAVEMQDRIRNVVINWPELVVDSLEERLDVEGFRFPGQDSGDKKAWAWWQANDLDVESQQAHIEALAAAKSFVIVGSGEDHPIITVESAEQVYCSIDPRTRKVERAIKYWCDDDDKEWVTLYLPDVTIFLSRMGKDGEWSEYQPADGHGKKRVPVVPVVNRRRPMNPGGRSELESVVPLSDAACKIATDMMVGAEFHALPRRWAVGLTEEDFQDPEGRPLSKWSRITGRIWTSKNENTKMGQFSEAQLSNFHASITALAELVASVAGLPPHYLGVKHENPASADAIRSSEVRLVKRAERRQRAFGGAWEEVIRLAYLMQGEDLPDGADRMETIWRDAATPTISQSADAAVKKKAEGIVPLRQTREDLGYTDTQIASMEAEDAKSATRVLSGDLAGLVGPKPGTPAPPA